MRTRTDGYSGDRLRVLGKGNKLREIPVHPELAKVRSQILSSEPASVGVLHSAWGRMRDRIGAVDVTGEAATSHSLRRTFADFMYDKAEVPQEVVGAILGHGKKVTELYAPVRFDRMKDAVERVDYTLGEPVQLALFETN